MLHASTSENNWRIAPKHDQNILQQNPHDAYSITHIIRNIEDTVGQALSGHSPDA